MAYQRRYRGPPEPVNRDTDLLDSMGWKQLDHPDASSADILCLHNNMEVLARLVFQVHRRLESRPPPAPASSGAQPIKLDDDSDSVVQRVIEDGRRKQEALRADAREHLELFTDYYEIWREKDRVALGEFSSYESEATVFFNTVRDGYLRQDFAYPDNHPLVEILNLLSAESRVLLFKELE